MAVLLKKEILHERVYCGGWKGRIVFFSRSNFDLKEPPFIRFQKLLLGLKKRGHGVNK